MHISIPCCHWMARRSMCNVFVHRSDLKSAQGEREEKSEALLPRKYQTTPVSSFSNANPKSIWPIKLRYFPTTGNEPIRFAVFHVATIRKRWKGKRQSSRIVPSSFRHCGLKMLYAKYSVEELDFRYSQLWVYL